MQYIFTSVFSKEPDGTISASFPDLPGFKAYGDNMVDAMKQAERALGICLFDMEQQSIPIPDTRFPDELEITKGDVAAIVLADTDIYHMQFADKFTSYNVELPEWLFLLAADIDLESSKAFHNAVKHEIGLPVYGVKLVTEESTLCDTTKIMSAVSDEGKIAGPCTPVEEVATMFYITKDEDTQPFIPIEIPDSFEIPASITPAASLKEPTYAAADAGTDTTSLTAPIARLQSEVKTETKTDMSQIEADITSTQTDLSTLDKSLEAVPSPERKIDYGRKDAVSPTSRKAHDPRFGIAVAGLLLLVVLLGATLYVLTQTDLLTPPPSNGIMHNPIVPSQASQPEANSNYNSNRTEGSSLNGYPLYTNSNTAESLNITTLRESYGNNDIIAILTINNTSIENQTITQRDNVFYRNHDINLQPSEQGWPYLCMWRNANNFDNLVIHGSGAPGGQFYDLTMFTNPDIFAQSPSITISTPYATHQLEVFSFYIDESNFDFRLESDWAVWIQGFANRSIHPSDVTVNENDSIVTLVAYVGDGTRNVLHARLIR